MTEKNKKILLIAAFLGVSVAVFARKKGTNTPPNTEVLDINKPRNITFAVFNKNGSIRIPRINKITLGIKL